MDDIQLPNIGWKPPKFENCSLRLGYGQQMWLTCIFGIFSTKNPPPPLPPYLSLCPLLKSLQQPRRNFENEKVDLSPPTLLSPTLVGNCLKGEWRCAWSYHEMDLCNVVKLLHMFWLLIVWHIEQHNIWSGKTIKSRKNLGK
jgi:hypothetical protein